MSANAKDVSKLTSAMKWNDLTNITMAKINKEKVDVDGIDEKACFCVRWIQRILHFKTVMANITLFKYDNT